MPIAAINVDMGLHNVIVSADNHKEIKAIIDWELCASAPFLAPHYCIEMLFRMGAPNGFGAEYPQADELRSAFWDAIPKWKAHWESQTARDFMEWFRIGLFMRPEYCSKEKSKTEKWEFWAENIRVVEGMLQKYGAGSNTGWIPAINFYRIACGLWYYHLAYKMCTGVAEGPLPDDLDFGRSVRPSAINRGAGWRCCATLSAGLCCRIPFSMLFPAPCAAPIVCSWVDPPLPRGEGFGRIADVSGPTPKRTKSVDGRIAFLPFR